MSFTLRQTTPRVGGGAPILRTRPIAAAEPVVGRGADCDILLPDLAVSLRHARLRQTGPGRVEIQSLGELPIEVGGRFPRAAELALAGAPHVVIGSHVLTLTAGDGPDEVVVAVDRRPGLHGAPSAADEREVFAPSTVALGKRRLAWALGLGILLVCLVLPVAGFFLGHGLPALHADRQWSSGPLSKAHAFLGARCQSCHQFAFVAARDGACMACHGANRSRASIQRMATRVRDWGSPVAPRLIGDHAAHGRLIAATPLPTALGPRIEAMFARAFNHPGDRCASCHLEHQRPDPPTPVRPIPLLVTVNSCAACHARLNERLASTPLLDVPDWGRHPDFRPLLTVSARGPRPRLERIALATRPIEYPGLIFSHRVHLAPAGGVARMAQVLSPAKGYGAPLTCASCHRPDGLGRGFAPVEMVRDCSACHSLAFARRGGVLRFLPHGSVERLVARLEAFYPVTPASPPTGGRRIPGLAAQILQWWRRAPSIQAASAIRTTFAPGGVCSYCHTIGRPRDETSIAYAIAPVHLTQRYLPRGAFDHGIPAHHQDALGRSTCAACHAANLSDRAGDVLIPRLARCAACHGKTKAQTPLAASAACAECHSYHAPGAATVRPVIVNWGRPVPPARLAMN